MTKPRLTVFDLESFRAQDLFRRSNFMRLGGYSVNGKAKLTTDGDEIARAVEKADVVSGHNIFGFDLPVLAHWHGLDLTKLIGKAIDTDYLVRLDDPPPSGKDGVVIRPRGYHGLDQSAQRYGVPAKTDQASRLAGKYARLAKKLAEGKKLTPDDRIAIGDHGEEIKALAADAHLGGGKYDGYGAIPVSSKEFRDYLIGDLVATDGLTRKLGRMNDYAKRDMNVGLITAQMQVNGFRVDLAELDKALDEQADRRRANLAELHDLTGMPLNGLAPVRSKDGNRAIMKALIDQGIKPAAIPQTESTGMMVTGKEDLGIFMEWLRQMANGRDISRVERIIQLVVAISGERTVYQTIDNTRVGDRVHPTTRPTQASGRWSVTGPGVTVMGKRQGRYVERRVLRSEEDEVLVCFDLDQVDARGVAAHSRDESYLAIFRDPNADLHGAVASEIFGHLITDDASRYHWREQVKPLNHGMNYGMGAKKAAEHTGLSLEVCEAFREGLRDKYPGVVQWQDQMRELAIGGSLLDNGFGRKLRTDPRFAYTQAPALVGQGCTRDIIAEGLLQMPTEFWKHMKVIVHDEVVFSLPKDDWQEMAVEIKKCMEFDLAEVTDGRTASVPITAGISKPGVKWHNCYEK